MELDSKKTLLIGLAKTGVSTVKALNKKGISVLVNDFKSEEDLQEAIEMLDGLDGVDLLLGQSPDVYEDIDLVVVSPGVPLDLDFIVAYKEKGVPVIGEVELAYRISNNPVFVGITGTNGKTTTTALTGEIFKAAGIDTYVVGNIGSPVIDVVESATDKSVLVTELSSFQLESIDKFRPRISSILNITEDHLNRHKTMENYIAAKANIFKNQGDEDYCILNYDDLSTRELAENNPAKTVFFSSRERLDKGVFTENGRIIIDIEGLDRVDLMVVKELSLPGAHNLENCMAAAAMAYAYGISPEVITEVLKTFKAVEHRLEYVRTVNNIKYVNDSKGTNPDSTIKAVEAYDENIVLIAGGYDKGSSFDELMEIASRNVKAIVTLGQTSDVVAEVARAHGITSIAHVNDMKEAVAKATELANEGEIVLLSPACASWGMYKNYEERGRDFKDCVNTL